jgi:hypothetical protein
MAQKVDLRILEQEDAVRSMLLTAFLPKAWVLACFVRLKMAATLIIVTGIVRFAGLGSGGRLAQ